MRIKSWQLGIGFVSMLLGMVFVFQLRTEWKIRSFLPTRQVNELSQMFNNQKMRLEKYEREIADLRKQLKGYDRDREIVGLRMAAGLLPLTGKGVVNKIITERATIEVTPDGLVLKEVFEGFTLQDVIDSTEAKLNVDNVEENVSI